MKPHAHDPAACRTGSPSLTPSASDSAPDGALHAADGERPLSRDLSDQTTLNANHGPMLGSGSSQKAKEALGKLLRGKDEESMALLRKQGPLNLLDLPLDILQMIIKEVTHTNDLAALALTHSALHSLAIPQIYSRFDIVWPDTSAQTEPRAGVDALTYGLATLVMAEDVFGEAPWQKPSSARQGSSTCSSCGFCSMRSSDPQHPSSHSHQRLRKRRRGNYYAEFTRKFSLGNGPSDWVQEYMVTKEGGKMLGTLVALAIARMRNLETFTWDMPAGILHDVWAALASLGEHDDGRECRLEKIWVRWHNNSKVEGSYETPPPPPRLQHAFWEPHSAGLSHPIPERWLAKRNRIERPTFSMLPPLKSLSVLDIDECAYLDEMSLLIAKSKNSLRELRVGIAEHAVACEWAAPWDGVDVSQFAKAKSLYIGTSHWEKRLGGVLGVLVSQTFDLQKHRESLGLSSRGGFGESAPPGNANEENQQQQPGETDAEDKIEGQRNIEGSNSASASPDIQKQGHESSKPIVPKFVEDLPPSDTSDRAGASSHRPKHVRAKSDPLPTIPENRLGLEVLELERVALSSPILCAAFDWTKLQQLTLIDCPNHTLMWNILRRQFCPTLGRRRASVSQKTPENLVYPLRLRKIHTNTVTTALLNFIKDALAPNTLEVLFLQQSVYHVSNVSIDAIMRAIRRHRTSLRKLSVDSSERDEQDGGMTPVGWQKWIFNRDMLNFITSGKMPHIRELGMAIDAKDWHFFLQRIPYIPHIRSLHIPFIAKADNSCVTSDDARELALQIIDIITIRPDIELCYLGIACKCFEILETKITGSNWRSDGPFNGSRSGRSPSAIDEADEDEEDDDEEDEEDEEEDDAADDEGEGADEDENTETEEESCTSEDEEESDGEGEEAKSRIRFDIREILFYDDKVAIFKARHGRL